MSEVINNSGNSEIMSQYQEIMAWDKELVAALKSDGLTMKAANLALHVGAYCSDLLVQLGETGNASILTDEQVSYLPILRDYCGSIQRIVFGG